VRAAKPQGATTTKVRCVDAAIDAEGRRQAAWPTRQVDQT
jgi:hypothetical protein